MFDPGRNQSVRGDRTVPVGRYNNTYRSSGWWVGDRPRQCPTPRRLAPVAVPNRPRATLYSRHLGQS
jgi:hypothetical protein